MAATGATRDDGTTGALRARRRARALGAALAAAAALAGCGGSGDEAAAPAPAPPAAGARAGACAPLRLERPAGPTPVVLIVNDTMRRDRVGAYGGPARTPAFDAFAREGLLLEAYSQAPWTLPSVATLFTSLYPSQHRMTTQPGVTREALTLPEALPTMAEVFRAAGYRTAAFVSNPWMTDGLGFEQGFDAYHDDLAAWAHDGDALSDAALAWLATLPEGQPFFLYLHYVDSHRPYPALAAEEVRAAGERLRADTRPVSDTLRQELAQLVAIEGGDPLAAALVARNLALLEMAYDKGVERFDRAFARFLAGFEAGWAGPRAAVIVTADHGEALYERGYGNHGQGLHDDEIAVPFAARLPGVRAGEDGPPCRLGLVDVLPTLCDYLGLACPTPVFGRSLFAPAPEGRLLVAEGVGEQPEHRSVRDGEWKLLYEPGQRPDGRLGTPWSLYHVAEDPGEKHDLAGTTDPAARAAYERLRGAVEAAVPSYDAPKPGAAPLDPDTARRLKELGYLE
jgi:arylsulfatase